MSNIPISSLPAAIALDGSEEVPIVQGGTTKRTTTQDIANTASGFVPSARTINTPSTGGLTGGGPLTGDLTLAFAPGNLLTKAAMVVADTFAINDSVTNAGHQATFPNAMKALTGLASLPIPNLTNDYLIINHAADGNTYKINPSSLALAAGNVPAGGLTSQVLTKASNADYDTIWSTSGFTNQPVNVVLAGPTSGPDAQPNFRLLVGSDLPDPQSAAKGGVMSYAAVSHQFLTSIGTNGAPASAQPSFSDISGTASVPMGGTGATTFTAHGILLGEGASAIAATAAMTDGQLLVGQTGVDPSPVTVSGDVTISALGVTAIGNNKVTNAMLRQSAGLSVIGNSTSSSANVADITGTANQVLRIASDGSALAFGSVNLASTSAVTGALGAANGGTGQSSYTTGDILYASGSTALSKLADVATGSALISGGIGVAPSWGKITPSHFSGTLPIANGGTGQTTASAAFDALAPTTTTGDLIYYTGGTNTRLALGSSSTFLRSNGTAASWSQVNLATDTTGQLSVGQGGTGATAFTQNGILYGNNTSPVQVTAAGTNGTVLAGNTGAAPTFNTVSAVLDAIGNTQGNILYRASTGWQSLAVGTTGQVLTTNGAGANPTWTSVSGVGTVTSVDVSGGTTGLTTSGGPITASGTITIAGTLGAANGGTGLTSYTQGDLVYASAATTIAKLAKDTNATRYLSNTGSSNNPAWAQINLANGVTGVLPPANLNATVVPQGRLTLTTGVPVLSTTVSAASTVYYTPYLGDLIPLYNGTNFVPTVFSELSQATTDTTKSPGSVGTNTNYDVFVWSDSGTLRATRGPGWTSATARGTGAGTTELVRVNGILLNANSITNGPVAQRGTYVGTIRSNGTSTIDFIFGASGTAAVVNVWNTYNRTMVAMTVNDSTASWSYTSATIRQAHGSAVNQISFISGLAEDCISASYMDEFNLLSATSAFASIGLAMDSTTTFDRFAQPNRLSASGTLTQFGTVPNYYSPQIGAHFISANEAGDGTNATTFIGATSQALVFTWRA